MLFCQHLYLDTRFADNQCRLQKVLPSTDGVTHKTYQDCCYFLNEVSGLDWECIPLSKQIMFMDLERQAEKITQKAKYKSCAKPESLGLSILASSARVKDAQRGVILSNAARHQRHCSEVKDCIKETKACFQRLLSVSYDPNYLKPLFKEGAVHLPAKPSALPQKVRVNNT